MASGQRYPKTKHRPASRPLGNSDRTTVGFRNFRDDRKAKTGARSTGAATTPEALEDSLPVLVRHPGAMIGDCESPVLAHRDGNLPSCGGMRDGILYQISDCIPDRVRVSAHTNLFRRYIEAERARLSECPRIKHAQWGYEINGHGSTGGHSTLRSLRWLGPPHHQGNQRS